MLVSGIVVLTAAFCGFAAGVGETLVNFKKLEVVTDGKVMGEWTATITEAKPVNNISMKTPVLTDLAADKMMIRIKPTMDGNALPPFEMKACEGLKDEMIGKNLVAAGIPFPDRCPIKKDNYAFRDLKLNGKKFPPGIPDGKLDGVLEIYIPGEDPLATINFEATVSHDVPGLG